jgi:hypothetical protein
MKRFLMLLTAVTVAGVLSAGPAQAQVKSFTDPVGDGQGVGRAAGMDITSVDVDYFAEGIEVYINFVDLKKGAYEDIIWRIVSDSSESDGLGVVTSRDGSVQMFGDDACEGAVEVEVSSRGDYAYLSAPASCLGSADKVRVQAGAEGRRGGDLDWTRLSKPVRQG